MSSVLQPTSPCRPGFTLIELLVSVAVIAILVALLLPAVHQVREAARRMSCRNNLKQIGIALHNYLETNSVFPPSFCLQQGSTLSGNNGSWSIHGRLMPFLDQANAADRVNLNVAWDAQRNTGVPTLRIPTFLCPSEVNDIVRIDLSGRPKVYPQNYGFNFGTWLVFDPMSGQGGDGSFFVNSALDTAAFQDGMSNTLCAAEVKAFTSYFRNSSDPGGTVPSSSSDLVAFASGAQFKLGDSTNSNTGHTEWCDGRVHHSGITTVFTPNTIVSYAHSDGITYDVDFNSRQEGRSLSQPTYAAVTSRSYHEGTVNVLLMDGSGRAISDSVDLAVWRALGTRAGGQQETLPSMSDF